MSNSIVAQVPKNLLFQYRIPCRRYTGDPKQRLSLDESYQLPHLGGFERQTPFADLRLAWDPQGIWIWMQVQGKKQSLWCRQTELLESDGLQIWIDTRNTHNVHRATKFCHWFVLLPAGGGKQNEAAVSAMLKINRSREDSPTINRQRVMISSQVLKNGYQLEAFIPGKTLHGWDTDEHQQLGFNYAVTDRELGWQTLAMGPELPIQEDPSLWQTLRLIDDPA